MCSDRRDGMKGAYKRVSVINEHFVSQRSCMLLIGLEAGQVHILNLSSQSEEQHLRTPAKCARLWSASTHVAVKCCLMIAPIPSHLRVANRIWTFWRQSTPVIGEAGILQTNGNTKGIVANGNFEVLGSGLPAPCQR